MVGASGLGALAARLVATLATQAGVTINLYTCGSSARRSDGVHRRMSNFTGRQLTELRCVTHIAETSVLEKRIRVSPQRGVMERYSLPRSKKPWQAHTYPLNVLKCE